MLYVIQVLSAILIGIAIGAVLGPRTPVRLASSAAAVALGLVAIFTGAWIFLAIGTAIFLATIGLGGAARAH